MEYCRIADLQLLTGLATSENISGHATKLLPWNIKYLLEKISFQGFLSNEMAYTTFFAL
jgi:hypothetical protein